MLYSLITSFFLLFYLTLNVLAKDKIEWSQGTIKLNNGELYEGYVSFNYELDIVSYQKDGQIKSFSPSKVKSFEYFDPEIDSKRVFIALDFLPSKSYKTKAFFELLLSGNICLVRRFRTFNQFYVVKTDVLTDNFGSFLYYAYSGGEFINLKKFKKQLLPLLKKNSGKEMIEYLEKNKLNTKALNDQLLIIDYYNFLKDPSRKMLSVNLP